MKRITWFISFCLLTLISSCAQKKDYVVTIKTDMGDMVAILYDETPKHKANFIKLAKEHFYDSLIFHRVIEGFMIQGGDPNSKNAQPGQHLGNGGPGYTVDAEFNPKFFHEKGALSAARLGDQQNPTKASSGSQFYIVQGTVIPKTSIDQLTVDQMKLNSGLQQLLQKEENRPLYDSLSQLYYAGDMQAYQNKVFSLIPRIEKETGTLVRKNVSQEKIDAYTTVGGAPHLDDEYTVFGKVIKGLEVIDKIAAVQRDPADRPLQDVHFTVTVEEMPKKKITKEYGYEYPDSK
ncbi:MAG TPA: peptidylprolyl isomerase [Cyclobacteriaceae bacterium]|nr:peptidylprolyl isomerase [Cyclobacteriaceae bacterium]HRX00521.1 peptidylprolyl isomerase [Cyclobacteriaceae bacterium]